MYTCISDYALVCLVQYVFTYTPCTVCTCTMYMYIYIHMYMTLLFLYVCILYMYMCTCVCVDQEVEKRNMQLLKKKEELVSDVAAAKATVSIQSMPTDPCFL